MKYKALAHWIKYVHSLNIFNSIRTTITSWELTFAARQLDQKEFNMDLQIGDLDSRSHESHTNLNQHSQIYSGCIWLNQMMQHWRFTAYIFDTLPLNEICLYFYISLTPGAWFQRGPCPPGGVAGNWPQGIEPEAWEGKKNTINKRKTWTISIQNIAKFLI